MEVSDDEGDGTEAGLELAKDEVALLKVLGMTPIEDSGKLTGTFSKPKARETTTTPEEEVAKSCGQNDALLEAQSNVAFYKDELAALEGSPAKAPLIPVLKSALKEAEDKVATFSKSTKTISLVSLQKKRANEMELEENRTAAATTKRE